ncbi:neural Wiskott-Aldrich syndrome protein-like isoform X1 [Podarcis lilfordi]|uniref:Neural Wiskott-Aldrich syndrome protein-like isoform X1 n=2 Tax=Podarcis lilfordi TaxID=74358 RepID=A0AA35JXT2_9SAUR|nr:neural Wiskott-Aldrich syndrome protein-like isoform X1 [Podarcis lilfordi]
MKDITLGSCSSKSSGAQDTLRCEKMTLFKSIVVIAPVAEATCPLSEPHHPTTRSPNCRVSSPSRCVSQTLREITNWKGKPRRHKLSKDYIGGPSNFKHLCHIGWSPQTGFATSLDPELKMIFAKAGITQDHLKDRRTSKKILEVIEKCGGVEAVLKEAKATGLLKKPLDHPLLYPAMPTELDSTCSPNNKQDSCSLGVKDGFKDVLAAPSSISKSDESSHYVELPAVVISPAPCTSPSKRVSQHNLIQNLKDVQLKKSKSDNRLTPFTRNILMSRIRKGTQLKPVAQNPMPPIDDDIVAALKDVVQKRHKAIHLSDTEESDLENGDEWND